MGRTVLGALAGGLAAAMAAWLASTTGQAGPFIVLVVLAVAIVGLWLGTVPALAAYVAAGVIYLVGAIPGNGNPAATSDMIRLLAFAVGSPVIILLALRADRGDIASRRATHRSASVERLAAEERQAAEVARRELRAAMELGERERRRLEEVAEAIPEPLIVYDEDGRGSYGNSAALRIFGRSFYDRPIDDWGREAEPRDELGHPLPRDEWPQLRARHGAFRRRILVRLPMSGRELLTDIEGTPLPGGGCVLLLRDVGQEVDERRRLSRFASFVAHELRNPLAVAKARIELANREAPGSTRRIAHGQRAQESVDAAISILERLELFSRAEAGRLEAAAEPFDLREAVDASIEQLRGRGSDREVQVTIEGEPMVTGDRQLSEQALTNLLTNADRYSVPEMPIEIEIDGGEVPALRVRDAGPGIPDDMGDVLFRDRVGSGRGLGIGLFVVHAAMEAQGGSVQLEERRPRAVFVLRWPGRAGSGE